MRRDDEEERAMRIEELWGGMRSYDDDKEEENKKKRNKEDEEEISWKGVHCILYWPLGEHVRLVWSLEHTSAPEVNIWSNGWRMVEEWLESKGWACNLNPNLHRFISVHTAIHHTQIS